MTKPKISAERIRRAAIIVAQQVQRPNRECFAPIFDRLVDELEKAEAREDAVDRAKQFLENQSA